MKNIYIVVGGAGFIASHLVDALLNDPATHQVRVIDNFSSGKIEHLHQHGANIADGRLSIHGIDVVTHNPFDLPPNNFKKVFEGVDTVFHCSANPDARKGIDDTMLDLMQETMATRNVLEAMRLNGVKKIIFASSGTVYGDVGETVCREGHGERLPISLYGAGKVASEALISGFCGTFGMKSIIFRFGNVVGPRLSHGAIYDWMKQLKEHPDYLNVLGDGNQSKPFIYVSEIVAGMLHGLKMLEGYPAGKVESFNIAPSDATTVHYMAYMLISQMQPNIPTDVHFGTTSAGWPGDVPNSRMNMEKLEATGFKLKRSSDEAVKYAIEQILKT